MRRDRSTAFGFRRIVRLLRTALASLALVGLTTVEAAALSATSLSVGAQHRCLVGDDGSLRCSGSDSVGQLGDGPGPATPGTVAVIGLDSGVAAVSVGKAHTCALTTSGGVKCWGWNREGQLGDGSTTDRSAPVDVVGLTSGVAAVAAGSESCVSCTADFSFPINLGSSTCALTTGGGVKCWGANAKGQLGDGTTTNSAVPVDVVGLSSGVAAVDVQQGHACALTTGGGVKCWGLNAAGELGDGTTTDSAVPVDVSGLGSGVAAIATGSLFSCALTTAGGVKCWGSSFGPVPADVPTLSSDIATIDAGDADQVCGVTTGGALRCSRSDDPLDFSFFDSGVTDVSVAFEILAVTDLGQVRRRSSWPAACLYEYGDADGDSICDQYDPCHRGSNFAGPTPRRSVMTLRRINDATTGDDQLRLSGVRFPLVGLSDFAEIDPLADGVRLVLSGPRGLAADLVLPGGAYGGRGTAGWVAGGGARRRWTFTDATGPRGKVVRRATILDRSTPTLTQVDVVIQAMAGDFPVGPDDLPLVVDLILGDAPPEDLGVCAYAIYTPDSERPTEGCTLRAGGRTLNCQK